MKRNFILFSLLLVVGCSNGQKATKFNLQNEILNNVFNSYSADSVHKKTYEHDGNKLKELVAYKDQAIDSVYYYKNGGIQFIYHKLAGMLIGPQYAFFSSGKLKYIYFHLNNNESFFGIEYDSSDGKPTVVGFPVHLRVKTDHDLHVNSSVRITNEVALIPNCSTKARIRLFENNKLVHDTLFEKFIFVSDINMNLFLYEMFPLNKGLYRYLYSVDILDTVTKRSLFIGEREQAFQVN